MKKLYTAAEIAQRRLPGLPTTKSSILARAAKEGWRYEEQYGIGGIRKVFEVPERYLLSAPVMPEAVSARQDLEEYLTADEGNGQYAAAAVLDESKLALAARIVGPVYHPADNCREQHAKTYGSGKAGNYPLHGRRQAAAGQVPLSSF